MGSYLIRLGHQYGAGEDPSLSLPVDVDLSDLFPGQEIYEFYETTLSGNRGIEKWKQESLDWTGSSQDAASATRRGNTVITLKALDIRTFMVTLRK